MIIVVTGSEGFLGRKVVSRLASAGHSVVAVDRLFHSGETRENVVYHQSELEDPSLLLPGTMPHGTPFFLVHLAWDMRRYQGYGIQAEQVRQFAGVIDYWGNKGMDRVLTMGSAEEFGRRSGLICEQDQPVFPLSPYGWAKRSARELAISWSSRTGFPVVCLRPFIMYGPGQKGDMVIPFAMESARLRRAAQMTDGLQMRDFIYIDDVVDAVLLSIQKDLSGFHEFNLGRGEGVKVADIVMTIARHYGVVELFELGSKPRRPGEPEVQVADTTKARDLLGWKASISWTEGLARTIAEEKK